MFWISFFLTKFLPLPLFKVISLSSDCKYKIEKIENKKNDMRRNESKFGFKTETITVNGKRWNYSLVFLTKLNLVKIVHPFIISYEQKKLPQVGIHAFYSCFTYIYINKQYFEEKTTIKNNNNSNSRVWVLSLRAHIYLKFCLAMWLLNPLLKDLGRFCTFID